MTVPDAPFLTCLMQPRPNGSRALEQAVESVAGWLEEAGILVQSHPFVLRPYLMELLGLWLATTGLLLPLAALGRWGVGGLALALLSLAIPLLEVRYLVPAISWLVRRPAHNLVAAWKASGPRREVVFCAHLDSKTELLDHLQRQTLLRLSRLAMVLALVGGGLTALERLAPAGGWTRWLAFAAGLLPAGYGLGMGANLVGGRLGRRPSSGAVDNGAAVAVLLALARRLQQGRPGLTHTNVTLLFTVGEEAQMQGALAYVHDQIDWPLPVMVVNLEVLGQDGGLLLFEENGTALQRIAVDAAVNQALAKAAETVTGAPPSWAPLISDDAFAFLRAGIPAATLGSLDRQLGERGLHSTLDHPGRVSRERLAEAVEVLIRYLLEVESGDEPGGADG